MTAIASQYSPKHGELFLYQFSTYLNLFQQRTQFLYQFST